MQHDLVLSMAVRAGGWACVCLLAVLNVEPSCATDTHFEAGSAEVEKRASTLATIANVLDAEKPDLVVFTGDVALSKPMGGALDALMAPVIERRIPWAAVLGNHDHEFNDCTRPEIVAYMAGQPCSLTQSGPAELGSGGNYVLSVQSSHSPTTATALYFLDSGAYTADRKRLGFYAWVPQARIEWYRKESRRLTAEHGGIPLPALAFFHIPLPEYREAGEAPAKVGQKMENVCAPELNSGLFTAFIETGDVMGTFVGHDHDNDYAATVRGICLAYGRKTGTFSYLKHLQSGARVIELREGERCFESWIRTHDGQVLDRAVHPQP